MIGKIFTNTFSSGLIIRIADRNLSDSGGLARKYSIRPAGVDMVVPNLSEGWDAFEQMASEKEKGSLSWTNSVGTALGAFLMPQLGTALSGILRQSHSLIWGAIRKLSMQCTIIKVLSLQFIKWEKGFTLGI